jgi:hypothetical protein
LNAPFRLTTLPDWAKPHRSLVEAILVERPKADDRRYEGWSWVTPHYRGARMEQLRKAYRTSGHSPRNFSDTPDGLIERLMGDDA